MLSILIPVYNCDIRSLASTLSHQIKSLTPPAEIIFLDDGSELRWKKQNREIRHLAGITYEELPENIGRSRVRNRLATLAQYHYLLFLDSDSIIIRDDFVRQYLENCPAYPVICGGRIFPRDCPGERYRLHWLYGTKRETLSRHGFQSNNFLIDKQLFEKIRFDESLQGYGHEDTLFGYQLSCLDITIHSIDNPVLHGQLEKSDDFLKHQVNALHNLVKLKRQYPGMETRLLSFINRLDRWGLSNIFVLFYRRWSRQITANLQGADPKLYLLDLLKLGMYLELRKENA